MCRQCSLWCLAHTAVHLACLASRAHKVLLPRHQNSRSRIHAGAAMQFMHGPCGRPSEPSAWLLRGRADVGAWHVRSCGQLRTGLQAWAGQIWLTLSHKPQTANSKPQTLKQQVHCRMECIAHRMVTDHSSGQALAAQQPAAHPLHTRHPTRTGRQAAGPCACSWKPGLGSRRPRGYDSHCRADLMWESLGGEIPPGRSHTPCMTQGSSRWIGRPR